MADDIAIEAVVDRLPADFDRLGEDAANEGHRHVERLGREWQSGANRFDEIGEALFVARRGAVTLGLGGVTRDPYVPNAYRMRRFFVSRDARRAGVGRELALRALGYAVRKGTIITVRAPTSQAAAFWEALGFAPTDAPHHTHVFKAPKPGLLLSGT